MYNFLSTSESIVLWTSTISDSGFHHSLITEREDTMQSIVDYCELEVAGIPVQLRQIIKKLSDGGSNFPGQLRLQL